VKPRYRLNPETLTYERIGEGSNVKLKNIIWVLLSGIGFAFVFVILVSYIYPSPHERQMKRDLKLLEENYNVALQKLEQSIIMYEQLLEKEKEIQKLTFDAEIEQLKSLTLEMSFYMEGFDYSSLMSSTIVKVKSTADKSVQLMWKIRLLFELAYGKKMFLQSVPAILPIEKDEFVLISGFGMRVHPIFKSLRQHNGVDLAARQGVPVVATGAGVVIKPPADLEGLGNIVAIDHGFGYISIYACLLKSEVKPGAKVERGDIIGSVGRSGVATGPHLHYEVRKNGAPLNPVNYFFMSISPEEMYEYLEKASVQNQNMS